MSALASAPVLAAPRSSSPGFAPVPSSPVPAGSAPSAPGPSRSVSLRLLPVTALCVRRLRHRSVFVVVVVQAWAWHLAGLLRARLRRCGADSGMTTAEYAVGTVAACGFAALLYKLLTGGAVSALLTGIIKKALSAV